MFPEIPWEAVQFWFYRRPRGSTSLEQPEIHDPGMPEADGFGIIIRPRCPRDRRANPDGRHLAAIAHYGTALKSPFSTGAGNEVSLGK
jgi:hypothetical protein